MGLQIISEQDGFILDLCATVERPTASRGTTVTLSINKKNLKGKKTPVRKMLFWHDPFYFQMQVPE